MEKCKIHTNIENQTIHTIANVYLNSCKSVVRYTASDKFRKKLLENKRGAY